MASTELFQTAQLSAKETGETGAQKFLDVVMNGWEEHVKKLAKQGKTQMRLFTIYNNRGDTMHKNLVKSEIRELGPHVSFYTRITNTRKTRIMNVEYMEELLNKMVEPAKVVKYYRADAVTSYIIDWEQVEAPSGDAPPEYKK